MVVAVQVVFMLAGFAYLLDSDSFRFPYLLIAITTFVCLYLNVSNHSYSDLGPRQRMMVFIGGLLACMVAFANYRLWDIGSVGRWIAFGLIFVGAFLAFWNILLWISCNLPRICWKQENSPWNPRSTFLVSFAIIAAIDLLVLFACKYPGNLSPDSISQMKQLMTNEYGNHHPFYHTLMIKACVSIGLLLFDDINAAVAVYSVASILFMATAFSFSIATVCELRSPKWIIVLLVAFFALMPYHIMYSMTMWKDIPFAACALLFVVFLFRCMKNMRLKMLNHIGLAMSALGFCLLRSNGWFAFLLTTLIFALLWKLSSKRILLIMAGALALSFCLTHPVLKALDVSSADLIESLSIPAQQIARDVIENDDFTSDENALLSEVIDMDSISDSYRPYISDPIKNLVRAKGNQAFIEEHAGEFAYLYVSRLVKHPFTYFKAWVDQTKGYWNAGYSYWVWANGVHENELGIERTVNSDVLNSWFDVFLSKFQSQPFLQIFLSIGFFGWLMLMALFIAIIRGDKVGAMIAIPSIAIVLSLLVATPVFSEFRYDYAMFCSLPIVAALALRPDGCPDEDDVLNERDAVPCLS